MEFLGLIDARKGSSELTPYASLLAPYDKKLRFALPVLRSPLGDIGGCSLRAFVLLGR